MEEELLSQVRALRRTLVSERRHGYFHSRVGEALNNIRTALLESLDDSQRNTMAKLIDPIDIRLHGSQVVSPDDAFRLCDQLESVLGNTELESKPKTKQSGSSVAPLKRVIPRTKQVFVIYGHDTTNTLRLRNVLKERFGLAPVILSEKPGRGRTLIEKFEEEAVDTSYAFALITPDDLVRVHEQEYAQARPNVVFEIGWFYGRLGRDRVCILCQEGTAIHSDLDGLLRIQFASSIEERVGEIENELVAAGLTAR